ncbi:MAG: ankyrin repeat domain-containing protein [Lachnospiraceae bacterium]|nr:ankyrin repeat domain-containing protein [Lachnospiraceae bacterium]
MDAKQLIKKLAESVVGPQYKFIPWWEDNFDDCVYWYNLFTEKEIREVEDCVAKCGREELTDTSEAPGLPLFHLLVWHNFHSAVKKILDNEALGIDVNMPGGEKNLTPLMLACCRGNLEMVRLLVEHGADSARCDTAGRNAYHHLGYPFIRGFKNSVRCENESLDQRGPIARLLAGGINTKDADGLTPLSYMLRNGDSSCSWALTEIFLEKGAETDYVDESGNTLLLIAVRKGHLTAALKLAERGDMVNTANYMGETPMQIAKKLHNQGLCMALEDCGSQEDSELEDCEPLDMINMGRITSNAFAGADSYERRDNLSLGFYLIKKLISKLDLDDEDDLQHLTRVLYAALTSGQELQVLNICREAGIDFTVPIHQRNAVFCFRDKCLSANYGVRIIQRFIEYGIDMNAAIIRGKTPANIVASEEHRECSYFADAAQLFSRESMEQLDDHGVSAVHRAAENGHLGMLRVMLEKGVNINITQDQPAEAGNTPLHIACIYGQSEIVRFLQDSGADITMRNINGELPAHHAVMEKKDGEKLTLKERAAVLKELKTLDGARSDGKTPLMLLQLLDTSTALALLPIFLNRGVNVNAADNAGNTALILQTKTPNRCSKEIAKELVRAGTDVNMADSEGNTALHYALQYSNQEMARFLIKKGADYNRTNIDGVSCVQLAVESGYDTVLELMKDIR